MKYNVIKASNDTEFGLLAKAAFCDAIRGVPYAKVILPTGDTPLPFYRALRDDCGNIPNFVYVQLDEYCEMELDDERTFANWLAREVLDPLNIRMRQTFNSAAIPDREASKMQRWMDGCLPLHLAVLGIGENGHVGFNEPGSSFDSKVRVVNLHPETIEQQKRYWSNSTLPPATQAFTLGISELRQATQTILLVRGEKKAQILRDALYGDITPDVPASYLQKQSRLTIIADEAALALIT
jgi:glucosamine-6-phosphate deaminase